MQLFYTNIIGVAPDPGTTAFFVGFITSGDYTQATLTMFAADTDFNAANIGLAGLQASGLEFA